MQIVYFKTAQTFIIEIDLHNALQFNPLVQKLLDTPIRNIRLPR